MYKRILLGADLASHGEGAMRKAWELANQFDARLYIVHVVESLGGEGDSPLQEKKAKAEKALAALADTHFVPKEHLFLLEGSPTELLLEKADELKVDVIVVGSCSLHCTIGKSGSTATAILHGAKCDVVVVRF